MFPDYDFMPDIDGASCSRCKYVHMKPDEEPCKSCINVIGEPGSNQYVKGDE